MTSNTAAPFPVRLATLQWGETDARPTALLLHGLTSAAGTWWRVASALAASGWSVTAPDLRGHGASPRTLTYRLADYTADVVNLEPAGAHRPWDLVVGHSLGGAVATVAAEANPDWTRAILLLDPVLRMPDEQHDAVVADLLGDLDRLDADELLRANPRWHTEDAVQKVNAARVVSPFVVERTVRDNGSWHLEPVAARIRRRVRVLGADPRLGASFTAAEGERLTAASPESFSAAIVEGAGHSIQRDDADRVVAEALALIAADRP
ncbi:alpha/beta hydrolase [Herbiconiux sp. UC225_62]|uniref:alpha/beta hydrolase n=1 Tax=Herbiconiux sp. UC225_62 TaxID=3350168 RepID=UPI0036D27F2B